MIERIIIAATWTVLVLGWIAVILGISVFLLANVI